MALTKKPYKGTRDFFPQDMRVREYLFTKMAQTAKSFGYEAYDGPLLEEVDLYLAKSGEELIHEQIYSFLDRGERNVAIRPEMTPTLARMVAQIHKEAPKPLRWFAIPNLMRYENPQKGRLREHWQFNADIFGAPQGKGEFEVLDLIINFLQSLGANQSHFEILINDRNIVETLMKENLGLDKETAYKAYKLIDRSKKIKAEDLQKQAHDLLKEKATDFLQYLEISNLSELKNFFPSLDLSFFQRLQGSHLADFIKFDPGIVRGLDYYTGVVFEVFDKNPSNRRAIAGGGAYANLLQIFNEEPLAGVGFGLGDVTLKDFLEVHNLLPDFSKAQTQLLLASMDDESETTVQKISSELRKIGVSVEQYFGNMKPKKIFTYQEKKGHPFCALIGSNEINEKKFTLKSKEKSCEFSFDQIQEIKDFIKD